jgi:hypothetical protein
MPYKQILTAFSASNRRKVILALLLAAGFSLLNLYLAGGWSLPGIKGVHSGSFLLAGLPLNTVTWGMPMFQVLGAAALNLGLEPALVFIVLHLFIYALVLCAGGLLGGYYAGLFSVAAAGLLEAGGSFTYDTEQALYSSSLLLLLSLILLKRSENTLRTALLCGLTVGASLLVRTPLFLFPPVFVLCDWLSGRDRSKAFARRSLVFIAASYVLLIPWGILNRSVSGEFSFFDGRRGASNIITAAKGSIYSMEGDSRRLAGIGEDDSAVKYFFAEVAKDPVFHARTVLRRLWHIFLFYPGLFGFLLLAILASREKNKALCFSIPVYFVLIHSFLSIEKRYFYPLLYLVPPLAIGSFFQRFNPQSTEEGPFHKKSVIFLFVLSFCAVLAVEALVLTYPYRAARNSADYGSFSRALERFPRDRVFREIKLARLRERGDYGGFLESLPGYIREFNDETKKYFLLAIKSRKPSGIEIPQTNLDCWIIRMLREFELGDRAAAAASLDQAHYIYRSQRNLLRGVPYETDRKIADLIRENSSDFWDQYVYPAILLWPPEGAAAILSGLKRNFVLTSPLGSLEAELALIHAHGDFGAGLARGKIFSAMFLDVMGLPHGLLRLIRAEDLRKSKVLSDLAVDRMLGGDLPGAEKLLREALDIYASNPEALMDLCMLRLRRGEKIKALAACRSASYAVHSVPENRLPGFDLIDSEASFERY